MRPRSAAAAGVSGPSGVAIAVATGGSAARCGRSSRPTWWRKSACQPGGLVGEVGPLAGHRADRAGVGPAGAEGEEVGEVEDAAVACHCCGQVALQPHQLRDLHLGRHRAADEVEHRVAARGAFLGLGERAVVEPDDDVPAVLARGRDGRRAVVVVERDQRAGGIEADAGDLFPRQAGLRAGRADGGADRPPDVLAVLLGVVGRGLVQRDRVLGARQHAAVPVEHARARAAGADVDRDHRFVRHCRVPPASPGAVYRYGETGLKPGGWSAWPARRSWATTGRRVQRGTRAWPRSR